MKLSKHEQITDVLFIKSLYFYNFLCNFILYKRLECLFINNLLKTRIVNGKSQTKIEQLEFSKKASIYIKTTKYYKKQKHLRLRFIIPHYLGFSYYFIIKYSNYLLKR